MKKVLSILVAVCIISTMFATICFADNPIIQTIYSADPAPMVYNDRVYVYTTHDEDVTLNGFFTMNNYNCISTTDMVNWTDHGTVASYKTFSWARANGSWAAQCIERNGKFYLYTTMPENAQGGRYSIGVAVADSPTGPFVDALGAPLISRSWDDIDPTVFIDDDGQAYMYWGNPRLYYVKLNPDMISYDRSIGTNGIVAVPMTTESFGTRVGGDANHPTLYEEGPWFYKREGLYYLIYPAGGVPEYIAYSTGPTATGPWTYRGVIMPQQGGSFTNHPGIIDYKGNSYFFYHNAALPGGGGYKRSVCVEKFTYNPDGTIPTINMTTAGAPQIAYLNPYVRTEAETICWSSGLKTEPCINGGLNIHRIDNGDYIKVKGVDFGDAGAAAFTASVSCAAAGGSIELRLGSTSGTLIGTLPVSNTGGWDNWETESTTISGAAGIQDLYLVFKGDSSGDLFKVDYWKFEQKSAAHDLVAINATIDKRKIDITPGTNTANMKVTAIYADGTSEDVTALAQAIPEQGGIVSSSNGIVTGVGYGSTTINVSYGGKTDVLHILVKDMESELKVQKLTVNKSTVNLSTGRTTSVIVTAEFFDGHTENVTSKATYDSLNPEIAEAANGNITAKAIGTTSITVSFKGELGDAATTQINVNVIYAPNGGGNVAWYKFDEESGALAIDSSGRGNDATIIGATGARAAGRFGNALPLVKANSQYAKLPNGIVSELDDFTISCWVRPATLDTWARIFDFGNNTDTYIFLTVRASTNNRPRFAIKVNGGTEQTITAGTGFTLSTNTWYHIAITKEGNTARMYLNGAQAAINTNMTLKPKDMGVTTNNLIGNSQWPDPFFDGRVDDFAIYDYALTADQVKALTIISIPAVAVETDKGKAPVLPGTVAVNYHNNTSGTAAVTWPAIDPSSYASAGTFTVTGTIADTALTATANVTVNQTAVEIVSVNEVNVTTVPGTAPVLPAAVTVVYSDNSTAEVPVVWDAIDPAAYAQPGTFQVEGTVEGTTIKAVAGVNVSLFNITTTFNHNSLIPGSTLTARVDAKNNGTEEYGVMVIVALYDDVDRMINVSYISKLIPGGGTESLSAGFRLPSDVTNHRVKVFVWDGGSLDTTKMQPLSNAVTLQ